MIERLEGRRFFSVADPSADPGAADAAVPADTVDAGPVTTKLVDQTHVDGNGGTHQTTHVTVVNPDGSTVHENVTLNITSNGQVSYTVVAKGTDAFGNKVHLHTHSDQAPDGF